MNGDPLTKVLTKLGVMEVRREPFRVVAFIRTFKHPKTNTTVTLAPQPNFAAANYYQKTNYDNCKVEARFTHVIYEDGYQPIINGHRGSWSSQVTRKLWPFVRRRPIIPSEAVEAKYLGSEKRDLEESRTAYQSTIKMQEPPMDPRAEKGCELLANSSAIPDGSKVSMPWHSMHVPYIQGRLVKMGYEVTLTREVVLLSVDDLKAMMLYVLTFATMVSAFIAYKIVRWWRREETAEQKAAKVGNVPPPVLGDPLQIANIMNQQQQQYSSNYPTTSVVGGATPPMVLYHQGGQQFMLPAQMPPAGGGMMTAQPQQQYVVMPPSPQQQHGGGGGGGGVSIPVTTGGNSSSFVPPPTPVEGTGRSVSISTERAAAVAQPESDAK